jgi:ribosome-binding factor A
MNPKRQPRKRLLSLCAEVDPDDGIDPKEFFGRGDSRRRSDRKVRQLCSQVAETLSYVLAGECDDDLLRSLQIVQVEPAPDSSRLLVIVRLDPLNAIVDPRRVLDRLKMVAGKLRCEVARAITRKRAPKLTFDYAPVVDLKESQP